MVKILVIEDEIGLREGIIEILKFEGYQVIGAERGADGIAIARKEMPDIILCDIMMPEMTGFDVLEELKKINTFQFVPFIFITALAERHNYRKGMEIGADDYLTKPFTREELLNAISSKINKYDNQKNKINQSIENIRKDLTKRLEGLNLEIETQKKSIEEISSHNSLLKKQLSESQLELRNEIMRVVETNNTLNNIKKIILNELNNNTISANERRVFVELKNSLKEKTILSNSWSVFQLKFNQVYPNFIKAISEKYPNLGQYDLVIISAMRTGLNSSHLAELLNISLESVRKSRYRLKKKMGLTRDEDLLAHILSFEVEN